MAKYSPKLDTLSLKNSAEAKEKGYIKVELHDNLTIADLAKLASEHFIYFTPHVGNKWKEDMLIANIPNVITSNFERNQSKKDDLDRPELLLFNGQSYALTPASQTENPILAPYLIFDQPENLDPVVLDFINRFGAKTPAQLHQRSTQEVLKSSQIELSGQSLFLGSENELIRSVMQELAHSHPQLFQDVGSRILHAGTDSNGTTYVLPEIQDNPKNLVEDFFNFTAHLVDSINLGTNLNTVTEGPMVNKEWLIICLALKNIIRQVSENRLDSNAPEFITYCISGPAMFKYSKGKGVTKKLNLYYQAIREVLATKFNITIPQNLCLKMIPGSSLDHISYPSEEIYSLKLELLARFKKSLDSYQEQRKELACTQCETLAKNIHYAQREMRQNLSSFAESSITSSTGISQYDLASQKHQLPSSEETLEIYQDFTFHEHGMISQAIQQAAARASKIKK